MKKLILAIILLTVLLITPSVSAYAYDYEPARADVAVEIIQGGTAAIIPEVNCPVPEKNQINLENGEIGKFNIDFTEAGEYSYYVKVVPDSRNLQFDSTVYYVKIYVTEEDGELVTTVIAYTDSDTEKYSSHSTITGSISTGPERLLFANRKKSEETETTTKPSDENPPKDETTTERNPNENTTDEGVTNGGGSGIGSVRLRNPKTGDDTNMERYFLIAMIASAGLLALSIIYMIDTKRLINSRK